MSRSTWERWEALRASSEAHIRMDDETECGCSCELRVTPHPHRPDGPDLSLVFFCGGAANPEEALERCLNELDWQSELVEEIRLASIGPEAEIAEAPTDD